jgi:cell division protein ZapA
MAVVHIRVGGREYDVACDDGQEDQLRLLADEVDDRVRALLYGMGSNPGENMALLLTSLTMADELIENKKEIQAAQVELVRLSRILEEQKRITQEGRIIEIEAAMTATLDDIAARIEKIAEQIEIQ